MLIVSEVSGFNTMDGRISGQLMRKRKQRAKFSITPGMQVKATEGDLGEQDVSHPIVKQVIRDEHGTPQRIVVQKGLFFQKKLEIPADRVQGVTLNDEHQKTVVVDARDAEMESLAATGTDVLEHEADLLDQVTQTLPTSEGLREKELSNVLKQHATSQARQARKLQAKNDDTVLQQAEAVQSDTISFRQWLQLLGPGFLAGMAGNDASAVGTYALDGATTGLGHLWLLLLSTPLYQATQYACATIGRVTRKGLAELLREQYGRPTALLAALMLIIANIALVTANLVAIGTGLQLLSGPLKIGWIWFVVPVALLIWYLTLYRSFESMKKIFLVMSLVFVAYIVTSILAKPVWAEVLAYTFIPHINFDFASISSTVALLGATISPYNIFWQVQGEKEQERPGRNVRQQLRFASLDTGIGVVSGNLIAYCIVLCTATTLFTHHKSIATAADAAQALVPILGPYAEVLFAIGLIGAGFVAIPVLLASTSYAVAGSFGWPAGLSKKPWQNEGFYLILSVALLMGVALAFLHIDPIQLLFWANVLSGILAPFLVIFIILLGCNRALMNGRRLGWLTMLGLVLTALVMLTASGFLFYGLFTGQS